MVSGNLCRVNEIKRACILTHSADMKTFSQAQWISFLSHTWPRVRICHLTYLHWTWESICFVSHFCTAHESVWLSWNDNPHFSLICVLYIFYPRTLMTNLHISHSTWTRNGKYSFYKCERNFNNLCVMCSAKIRNKAHTLSCTMTQERAKMVSKHALWVHHKLLLK